MKFYQFDMFGTRTKLSTTDATVADPVILGDAPRCETCQRYVGGRVWLPPRNIELELWGDHWNDIVVAVGGSSLLFSERYARLHSAKSLSGLKEFCTVNVKKLKSRSSRKGLLPPTYFASEIIRSKTRILELESGIEREPSDRPCTSCGGATITKIDRLIVDPLTWSGEDWFIPQNLMRFMCTERVVSTMRTAGLDVDQFLDSTLAD